MALAGEVLSSLYDTLEKYSIVAALSTLALILTVNTLTAHRSLLKATMPNPDVLSCARLISSTSNELDLIATLSDVSRYNSLAFYSKRLAINVENDAFPISRYIAAGA